jgi:hypothetical protein
MKQMLLLIALWSAMSFTVAGASEFSFALPGAAAPSADTTPHPVLPADTTWAGVVVIVIVALFVAATAVGITVRFNAPEEVPPTHSHDEPPGTSGHHGASGTIDHHGHQH